MPKYTHQLHGWFYPRRISYVPPTSQLLYAGATAIVGTDSATLTDSGAVTVLPGGYVQILPVGVSYAAPPVVTTVSSAS